MYARIVDVCMYRLYVRMHARFLDAVFHRRLFLADKRVAAKFLSFLFHNDENSPVYGMNTRHITHCLQILHRKLLCPLLNPLA